MAKKAKPEITVPLTGDMANLFDFWREIVTGRLSISDDQGEKKEIIVPLEVRIRASELLAKHLMPKGGRLSSEREEEEVVATPDILRVAQMLESKAADAQLAEAFALVRNRKRENA